MSFFVIILQLFLTKEWNDINLWYQNNKRAWLIIWEISQGLLLPLSLSLFIYISLGILWIISNAMPRCKPQLRSYGTAHVICNNIKSWNSLLLRIETNILHLKYMTINTREASGTSVPKRTPGLLTTISQRSENNAYLCFYRRCL